MKVTFVYPYIPYKFAKTPYPPLGIGYLAAVLREKCDFITNIRLIDGQILDEEKFWHQVKTIDADIVLISATIRQLKGARLVAKEVKKNFPLRKVILGGPGPSALVTSTDFFEESEIDIVVKGEAEETLPTLLGRIWHGELFEDVPNVSYQTGGKTIIHTPTCPTHPDINNIPWPDRTLFDEKAYLDRWQSASGMTSVHIMGSRGCPFGCSFCDKTVTGRGVRYRDADDVVAEMLYLEKRYAPSDIFYFDDLFTVNKKRVIALCDLIKKSNLQTPWSAQGRVDCIDRQILLAMKEAGCEELMFGVESGSDRILKYLTKGCTKDQIIAAFDLCHSTGIKPGAYLIVGVPGETQKDILETIALVERIEPYLLNLSYLTPFPNTELYTATQQWIGDWDYEQWDDFDNSIYMCEFELDPRQAHKMILDAYHKKIQTGMSYGEYQFAND